jgi:hypothetical protein
VLFISSDEEQRMLHSKTLSAPIRTCLLLVGVLFILSVAGVANAQSGRHLPKHTPSSDVPPPDSPDSKAPADQPEAKKNDKPGIPITITKHLDDLVYGSDIYLSIVMEGFLQRMSQTNKAVSAMPSSGDLNRKEAYDLAKTSKDHYVVWYSVIRDTMATTLSDAYYVDFVIFLPDTGKTKTNGHVYLRPVNAGGVAIPQSSATFEYMLRNAGKELAERVLDSLDIDKIPPIH